MTAYVDLASRRTDRDQMITDLETMLEEPIETRVADPDEWEDAAAAEWEREMARPVRLR